MGKSPTPSWSAEQTVSAARAIQLIDTIGRLDLSRRMPLACTNLEKIGDLRLPVDIRRLLETLEKTDAAYTPKPTALVHGDFYVRHFLVRGDGRLSGVIEG